MTDPAITRGATAASRLSEELRHGSVPYLLERRAVAGLALAAIGSMGVISLYQLGLIGHLPEPPLPGLDADRVVGSAEAYGRFDTPDAVLGLGSYAVTLGLAAAGRAERVRERPWLPLARAGKVAFDVLQAAKLTRDQWTKHRAFCSWCLLAAGATLAMAPLVVPEAQAALAALRGRQDGERREAR
jgi:hypothetical protein